jgi:vacuolar-type H+-ATPase subunit E/Vma4
MENLSVTDLNRMIQAIQHECAIRIKEIKLEANQEHNLIKNNIISQTEKKLVGEFKAKIKKIEKDQENEESNIEQRYKLKIDKIKEEIINSVVAELTKLVTDQPMDTFLIEQITDKIKKNGTLNESKISQKGCYVFCLEIDRPNIIKIFEKNEIDYELRNLPTGALGGLILCSKDGNEIWDNTFETRINIMIEHDLDKINKAIFH